MGSALPDPVKDQAAIAPVPQQAIENKPAPGQTGPKGLSPRTTYSRVNTGSPPVMDAGAVGQKSGPNRGLEFLPAKIAAQRGFMTTMRERPSLQDMVKAAMEGTRERLAVNLEAAHQSRQHGEKTASATPQSVDSKHISTELALKLASAVGYIEQQLLKEAELAPGEGPGALPVMEAQSSETNIDAGESGQATSQNQPPRSPSLQPEKAQQGNAGTGLQTNDEMKHPEQPTEPIKNASGLEASNLARLTKLAKEDKPEGHHFRRALLGNPVSAAVEARKGSKMKAFGEASGHNVKEQLKGLGVGGAIGAAGGAVAGALKGGKKGAIKGALTGGGIGAVAGQTAGNIKGTHDSKASEIHGKYSKNKHASDASFAAALRKLAEDAINPAQIDGGGTVDPAQPPEGASAAGEGVPSEPSDVTSQKRLIQSNEAAINYTKGEAKADPKKDVAQVLAEPPLSSSTDKVLDRVFDSTGKAGVKISSAGGLRKTAMQVGATRVLLSQLIKQANEDCGVKAKKATGLAPTTPQAATGASAATMGQ